MDRRIEIGVARKSHRTGAWPPCAANGADRNNTNGAAMRHLRVSRVWAYVVFLAGRKPFRRGRCRKSQCGSGEVRFRSSTDDEPVRTTPSSPGAQLLRRHWIDFGTIRRVAPKLLRRAEADRPLPRGHLGTCPAGKVNSGSDRQGHNTNAAIEEYRSSRSNDSAAPVPSPSTTSWCEAPHRGAFRCSGPANSGSRSTA